MSIQYISTNKNYKRFLPDNWNNGYSNVKINILES